MAHNNSRGNLWSIMMAGGEGRRVRSFVERWLGRPLPKQFCAFVGKRSLLQHTVDRAARLTAAEQSVLVIAQAHRKEAMTQLDGRRVGTLLFQPADRDTGAGLFLPLTYVRARAPLATVIIYPSDHFVYPEDRFLDSVREAVPVAEQLHDRIVLLGVAPDRLELDYGWILPGEQLAGTGMKPVLAIRKFIEKPTAQQADDALAHHALWNSMVIVSKVETLWRLGQQLVPELIERFERLGRAIGASDETRVLDAIYQSMPFRNFFSDFLQQMPERATMMELTNALWSDWGKPERITESLRRIGRTPAFPLEILGSPFAPRLIEDRIPTGA